MGQGLGFKRRQDWQGRLNAEIMRGANRKFRYGTHDCCISVTRCVRAVTGVDPMTFFGRRYRSKAGADSLLRKYHGVRGFIKHIGLEKIPISYATGGDVVIVKDLEGLLALGVVGLNGREIFVAARPSGWATLPLRDALGAYKIP